MGATVELPFERPLYRPPLKVTLDSANLEQGGGELDTEALFSQIFVDRMALLAHIREGFGSTAGWLETVGVTAATISTLAAALIEDPH